MDSKKRPLGFWESVGVHYEAEHAGPVGGWRASMPGERIVGHGRTKQLALADLKSAHARTSQFQEGPPVGLAIFTSAASR